MLYGSFRVSGLTMVPEIIPIPDPGADYHGNPSGFRLQSKEEEGLPIKTTPIICSRKT